ncbi:hepatocellular carcinoma-associated antigen 59-domain-containing protein [Infundibulicybe gibba]|nr:hepatocellular carcinoma-associated antigen 59-domain-containing protein [Infundibulicybe gibba]
MIKKRTRPQPRVREVSPLEGTDQPPKTKAADDIVGEEEEDEDGPLPLADLIELRRLRKGRQGIDAARLNKGDVRKKKRRVREEEELEAGGLRKGVAAAREDEEEDEEEKEARARRVVRANNFTQQTNALDVDKHMMAYIEENLKIRSRPRGDSDDEDNGPADPQEALYRIADRWKVEKQKPTPDDGSVTNSMTMLTAIPEVDLGMDTRLKNIEETEKAKRVVAEERHDRKRPSNNDEEHLAASRFYRPNLKTKSDSDIMRDAKLEAMGMPPQDDAPRRSNQERTQMATDEIVMERFKKRMRK